MEIHLFYMILEYYKNRKHTIQKSLPVKIVLIHFFHATQGAPNFKKGEIFMASDIYAPLCCFHS